MTCNKKVYKSQTFIFMNFCKVNTPMQPSRSQNGILPWVPDLWVEEIYSSAEVLIVYSE